MNSTLHRWILGAGLLVLSACSGTEVGGGSVEPFEDFETYQLTYTSTCGEGQFVTPGTTIRFFDGAVEVVDGFEPGLLGSIGVWNFQIENAAFENLRVETQRGPMGEPISFSISRPGAEPDVCVSVTNFSAG